MVMALGILAEAKGRARAEGREEGREEERLELLQALREDGLSEDRIQRIMDRLDARTKGARES